MKRKFISILLTLVLALSLCLVMTVPVVAEDPENGVELVAIGDATAEWSTGEANTGSYSVKLTAGTTDWVDWAGVQIPVGELFSDISATHTDHSFYYITNGTTSQRPAMALIFEVGEETWKLVEYFTDLDTDVIMWTSADLKADLFLMKGSTNLGTAEYWSSEGWIEGMGTGFFYQDLSAWQVEDVGGTALGSKTVDCVEVSIGALAGTVYVDDVTIDGVSYELEPIVLGAEYYKTGATVDVTVYNGYANGTIAAFAKSDTVGDTGAITFVLSETSPGEFTGTFDLVDATPEAGELLVNDGDTITVKCLSDWGAGSQEINWGPTATIDDTLPVVAITSHEDGDFVTGDSVVIDWTIDETNQDTLSVTIGGEVVVTDPLTYTWNTKDVPVDGSYPEDAVWPDGSYTIEVVVTDLAGLVGSASIDVTVDNTAPEVSEAAASPTTILPDDPTQVTFTATVTDDLVEGVTGSGIALVQISDIPGVGTLEMLDEDADGIYTASTEIEAADATYELTVTAVDEVGNAGVASEVGEDEITFVVSTDIDSPDISDAAITYPVGAVSARVGDPFAVSAVVVDLVGLHLEDPVTLTATEAIFDIGEEATDTVDMTVEEDSDLYMTPISLVVATGIDPGEYELTITGKDTKGNLGTAPLTLVVTTSLTGYNIDLVQGWNLISLPLIPDVAAIETVLADLIAAGTVEWVDTFVYENGLLVEKKWELPAILQITQINDGQGYWVNMTTGDTLTISGLELPTPPNAPPTYQVYEGWNLIGIKSVNDIEVKTYLGGAVELTLEVIYSYDATNEVYELVGSEDSFEPGAGYWLAVNDDGTIYP